MFHSARLRLTAWYLAIIMSISILFSAVIYQRFSVEIDRISNFQQGVRVEIGAHFGQFPETSQLFDEIRRRTLLNLILINAIILIASGLSGYFLAGLTLRPIEEMLDDQNRFLADASHELRTPLTALKTELEVALRDKTLTITEARELLHSNVEEVDRLRSLSDGLLMMAHHTHNGDATRTTLLSLDHLIESAIKKVAPMAKQKRVTVEKTLKNVRFEGDETGLTNLLVILLDNAIKYSHPKQKVIITNEANEEQVHIHIEDFGIGIASKDIPHIFKRFYRADAARSKQRTGGHGLGLSIANHIVEQHGGHIAVKSTPNKGTTFTIQLPRRRS